MKIFKVLFKIIGVVILAIVLLIAAILLFIKFQGKAIIEKSLSRALGFPVKIEKIQFDLDKGRVDFQGFHILSKGGFSSDILTAKSCIVSFKKDIFKQKRKFVIEELIINNGIFNIQRNKKGKLNIVCNNSSSRGPIGVSLAYADEFKDINFYSLANQIGKITIKNSLINFKDEYISNRPYKISCSNVDFNLMAEKEVIDCIPLNCALSFNIVNGYDENSQVSLKADIFAYKDHSNIKAAVKTSYIDIMQFYPYLKERTPFIFREGLFSSNTNFNLNNGVVDSLTTMLFHKLVIAIEPGKENSEFLQTSVSKLLPYLTSSSGDILFDFVIRGPLRHPKVELGPYVKQAITMAVIQEVGKIIQQFQRQ